MPKKTKTKTKTKKNLSGGVTWGENNVKSYSITKSRTDARRSHPDRKNRWSQPWVGPNGNKNYNSNEEITSGSGSSGDCSIL